jgi:hypothetical protein
MRFLIAIAAAASFASAGAGASQWELQAGAPASIELAQFTPGSCRNPGTSICVSGWVAVCQCYVYGCNYVPSSYRCGLGVRENTRSKERLRPKAD